MAILIPPEELLSLYGSGWFPMAMEDGSIRCYSPDPRGVLPLDEFHIPHGARKTLADPAWEVRLDTAFPATLRHCADRDETWIDDIIFESYLELHRLGHAHSVEVWRDGQLAGGLYGVELGSAFFGESMFHLVPGASKVALAYLVQRLRERNFHLLDVQWTTPHLVSFGAKDIPRDDYLAQLEASMAKQAHFL